MSTDSASETLKPHSWVRIWAEVAGAWAISLAYPLYSNIASGPEALTSYGMRRFDVLILILVVSLLGPLVIMLAELVIRRLFGEPVRRVVQGVVVGALLALVVWQWLVGEGTGTVLRNLLPVLMAAMIAWLYVRTELVRNFALMLSFATVVVIGAFAIDYPIRDELLPHEAKASTPEISSETPVVLVIFDELPAAADRTGLRGDRSRSLRGREHRCQGDSRLLPGQTRSAGGLALPRTNGDLAEWQGGRHGRPLAVR